MKKPYLLLLMSLSVGVGTAMAGVCPVGPPTSRGNGTVAGVPVSGGGMQYYFPDALLGGFDCFEELSSFFPSYIHSTNSINPAHEVVDMAYATEGTATFFNVVASTTGNYTLTFRYAFATGLYPGVENRPEGIMVNGVVITNDQPFPVTGNFETFQNSSLVVPLIAGKNTIQMFNIAPQSISRADAMTVTPVNAATTCTAVPNAPTGLSASAASTSQINLNWTGSTAPVACSLNGYSVFRSTTPGFVPSGANEMASGLTTTTYSDATAACGTTYYYAVEAADADGSSAPSGLVSAATGQCPATSSILINSGGPTVEPFITDTDFAGGGTISHTNTIDLSGVTSPAPMSVYQDARTGNFTYTVPNFNPNSNHTVRLHFAETFFTTAGSRTFNVSINGASVLTNFDIVAAAGGKDKAIVEAFTVPASSTGSYVISFTSVVNQSLVSGIEIQ